MDVHCAVNELDLGDGRAWVNPGQRGEAKRIQWLASCEKAVDLVGLRLSWEQVGIRSAADPVVIGSLSRFGVKVLFGFFGSEGEPQRTLELVAGFGDVRGDEGSLQV